LFSSSKQKHGQSLAGWFSAVQSVLWHAGFIELSSPELLPALAKLFFAVVPIALTCMAAFALHDSPKTAADLGRWLFLL
jgi:hypothetical protein